MSAKYFTLEEANGLLPSIDRELRALQELKRRFEESYLELRRQKERRGQSGGSSEADPFFMMEAELEFIQIEARGHIQSIHGQGIELKDIDIGLVDFPALLDGQEVLLCWRQGEDRIRYYHNRHDGFAGRKPLVD
ncbi:DUF2203 domain-containing protein [Paenibacillus athensensis]|uniref:Cell division protein DivIVA n=1 Tax=Paenibacillus athensensis TaxID=1967502 RepID=A0A4Y8PYM0_9BACL|nr:DUF2203 domain-containing protein [Paenibacillus athensensis]MCD1259327.1 DUF2203 domain-containing protein [Paenibacillus athensensis]